jgi:hypothetical protein
MVLTATVVACATAKRSSQPPVFTKGVWRVRIDVDSAPSRRPSEKPIFGMIDFATARYSIDFWLAINRRLPNGAHVVAIPQLDEGRPTLYKITLGDSSSFDEKVVFLGRQVTPDSIVGTWEETILCCAAGGRFSLWRSVREPSDPSAPHGQPF